MDNAEKVDLLKGYNEWLIERKRQLEDLTPEAYLEDKLREDAAERLIKAIDYIETLGEWNENEGSYGIKATELDLRNVEEVLRGTL